MKIFTTICPVWFVIVFASLCEAMSPTVSARLVRCCRQQYNPALALGAESGPSFDKKEGKTKKQKSVGRKKIKCPVCFEKIKKSKIVAYPCGHQLCKKCRKRWDKRGGSCYYRCQKTSELKLQMRAAPNLENRAVVTDVERLEEFSYAREYSHCLLMTAGCLVMPCYFFLKPLCNEYFRN